MRKFLGVTIAVFVFSGSMVSFAQASSPSAKFKNCTELRKKYPNGVAKSAKTAGNTGATVNAKVYAENKGSDRDNDGVACES